MTPEEAANARPSIEWVDKDGHHHPHSSFTVQSSTTEKAENCEDEDEEGDDQERENGEENGEVGFADGLGDSPGESSDDDRTDPDFESGRSRKRKTTTRKAGGKSRR